MDIALLSPSSVKIKGKSISFLVEPRDTKGKITGECIITFDSTPIDISSIEEARVILNGPGDYEIGGVKIAGIKSPEGNSYFLSIDGLSVFLARASSLHSKESLKDASVVVLFADSSVDMSLLATISPSVVVVYGPSATATLSALGKPSDPVNKYSVTKDKLPTEMEAVLLQQ